MCCILGAAREFQSVVNQVLGGQSSYSTPIYILPRRLIYHFPILKNSPTTNSHLALQSAIARDLNSFDSHFEVCGFRTRLPPCRMFACNPSQTYKPPAKSHLLYFRHLNLHQLYPHMLEPNCMPNAALFIQLSASGWVDVAGSSIFGGLPKILL
jgi:hypothetical protein